MADPRTRTKSDLTRGLANWLDQQSALAPNGWFTGLDPRKREEAAFHDADRVAHRDERAGSSPNRRFYEAATPVRDLVQQWLARTVPGRTFLDYACGNGLTALTAARSSASLAVGIDISEVSVRNALENAAAAGLSRSVRFLQRDCEATGLPDNSFDACLCSGMLHHLDLTAAFPELHRITAPRGRILCVEALGYNPFIQFYRERTPNLRTAWEKDRILTLREVRFATRWFRVENIQFHLMAAPLATVLPRAMRPLGIRIGHALDAMLTRTPLLQRWSWMFSFELVKP
jgi:SAM-dependent methyltransferase